MTDLTLSTILAEGYRDLIRKSARPIQRPALALGEVEALMAFCAAELDRHCMTDRDIRNCYQAATSMEAAEQQQTAACQSVGDACAFLERDRDLGWVA